MFQQWKGTAVAVVLAWWVGGCGAAPAHEFRQYELQGQILAIKPETSEVLIRHGDIRGFMPGMTMPFQVRDRALLEGKTEGDLVTATLVVEPDEAWLSAISKTGSAPVDAPAAIPAAAFVQPLKAGDPVPDTMLTDHHGKRLSLADWKGSAIAVTFMYVRCPLPQFCPLLDRRFAEMQRLIAADAWLRGRARLLSVSFDPDADTVERLAAHAAKHSADAEVWRFATAERQVVDRFAASFGVNVIRERDATITHNMRTAVIAPDGRVARIFEGSEWTARDAAAEMQRVLSR
jgi:protein SCO1